MLACRPIIGILMSFFASATLHQVTVVTAYSDKELDIAVNGIIKNMNGYIYICENSALKKPLKDCLLNADKQLNSNKDLKFQCEVKFNRDLCIIDVACKWCERRMYMEFESSIKNEWSNGNEHKQCAPWYGGFEYATKTRCEDNTSMVIVVVILGLILLSVGIFCLICGKPNLTDRQRALAAAGSVS